jgi:hypothetical protein
MYYCIGPQSQVSVRNVHSTQWIFYGQTGNKLTMLLGFGNLDGAVEYLMTKKQPD